MSQDSGATAAAELEELILGCIFVKVRVERSAGNLPTHI